VDECTVDAAKQEWYGECDRTAYVPQKQVLRLGRNAYANRNARTVNMPSASAMSVLAERAN
jgi:hypothetical protein